MERREKVMDKAVEQMGRTLDILSGECKDVETIMLQAEQFRRQGERSLRMSEKLREMACEVIRQEGTPECEKY